MTREIPLLKMSIGGLLSRALLLFFVIIWTLPTAGLLISSLRDKDQLSVTGWWTALQTVTRTEQSRIAVASTQTQRDGLYVIEGKAYDSPNKTVNSFGFNQSQLGEYEVGETIELENGIKFKLNADGSYVYSSPQEITFTGNPPRFFYIATVPPLFSTRNYEEVLVGERIGQAFINTFTVTIPATIIPIAIAAFAAYAFSWMEFPGRRLLFIIVVGLLVVPLQMSLIPLLRLYNEIGIARTYPGIWLAHTGFGLPLAIYLLRNYIGGLPRELIESAKIDGASHFQIFVRLVLPLSVPALASFAIFQFLWVWNDLLVALVFLGKRPDQIVLTSALRELMGSRAENWEILTSSAFISIAVPLIVFFSLQRYFVRGLLAGSVKGG